MPTRASSTVSVGRPYSVRNAVWTSARNVGLFGSNGPTEPPPGFGRVNVTIPALSGMANCCTSGTAGRAPARTPCCIVTAVSAPASDPAAVVWAQLKPAGAPPANVTVRIRSVTPCTWPTAAGFAPAGFCPIRRLEPESAPIVTWRRSRSSGSGAPVVLSVPSVSGPLYELFPLMFRSAPV